jgi:hypothetical protein
MWIILKALLYSMAVLVMIRLNRSFFIQDFVIFLGNASILKENLGATVEHTFMPMQTPSSFENGSKA